MAYPHLFSLAASYVYKRQQLILHIMDKMKLGGGGRYEKLIGSLEKKGVKDPAALAAYIGRKKLGKAKFQSLAAKGRRRAMKEG